MWGIPHRSTLRLMRDTLTATRALMCGETVTYDSPHFQLEGALGYRAHYLNQGFAREVAEVDAQRTRGISDLEQLDQYPEPLVRGYYGRADGAVAAFQRLSAGLDMATLSIGAAGTLDVDGTKALLRRFSPAVLRA